MNTSQNSARHKYAQHKSGAKKRGIEFKLTFEEWMGVWGDKLDQRGVRSWQLGMCRIGDKGAYEVGNVYLGTPARNRASQRMALENKRAAESRHVHYISFGTGERYDSDEETDEQYIARKMGLQVRNIYG